MPPRSVKRRATQQRAFDRAYHATEQHRTHRANDEIACSCGKRWPVGEDHP